MIYKQGLNSEDWQVLLSKIRLTNDQQFNFLFLVLEEEKIKRGL
jgi:hypothetical protein